MAKAILSSLLCSMKFIKSWLSYSNLLLPALKFTKNALITSLRVIELMSLKWKLPIKSVKIHLFGLKAFFSSGFWLKMIVSIIFISITCSGLFCNRNKIQAILPGSKYPWLFFETIYHLAMIYNSIGSDQNTLNKLIWRQ